MSHLRSYKSGNVPEDSDKHTQDYAVEVARSVDCTAASHVLLSWMGGATEVAAPDHRGLLRPYGAVCTSGPRALALAQQLQAARDADGRRLAVPVVAVSTWQWTLLPWSTADTRASAVRLELHERIVRLRWRWFLRAEAALLEARIRNRVTRDQLQGWCRGWRWTDSRVGDGPLCFGPDGRGFPRRCASPTAATADAASYCAEEAEETLREELAELIPLAEVPAEVKRCTASAAVTHDDDDPPEGGHVLAHVARDTTAGLPYSLDGMTDDDVARLLADVCRCAEAEAEDDDEPVDTDAALRGPPWWLNVRVWDDTHARPLVRFLPVAPFTASSAAQGAEKRFLEVLPTALAADVDVFRFRIDQWTCATNFPAAQQRGEAADVRRASQRNRETFLSLCRTGNLEPVSLASWLPNPRTMPGWRGPMGDLDGVHHRPGRAFLRLPRLHHQVRAWERALDAELEGVRRGLGSGDEDDLAPFDARRVRQAEERLRKARANPEYNAHLGLFSETARAVCFPRRRPGAPV